MHKTLLIGLAGAAGTLSRYWLSGAVQRIAGIGFPLGTFAVNGLGSLLFGLVWGLFEDRIGLPGEVKIVILAGFMGAFTTFSTFMFETVTFLKYGQYLSAFMNVFGQIAVGAVCVVLGIALGKWI